MLCKSLQVIWIMGTSYMTSKTMKAQVREHQKKKKKMYKELGLKSLKCRRWFRHLYCFFEKLKLPSYLFNLV